MPRGIYKHKQLSEKHKKNIGKGIKKYLKLHPPFKGKNNPHWKGGQYKDSGGYIHILKPNHPFCNKIGYVKRANLIIEKYLGRYLSPKELVHHKNGIRDDDRPENLQLFVNASEHQKFHCPKGIHFSPATEFKKGNSGYWLGKHRSKETKRKLSLANKGKKLSEEHKQKISQGLSH